MKKIVRLLIGILAAVFIILSLLCMHDGYSAERDLWLINRQLYYVNTHIESTTDYQMNALANKYRDFIKKYASTIYSKYAQVRLGDLYTLRKDYTQAIAEYQKAICKDPEVSADAAFTIARTYEILGNERKALDIYKNIQRLYPLTKSGFAVPMYLANKPLQAEGYNAAEAYSNAVSFYTRMIQQHPKSMIGENAYKMLTLCELNQKDWPAAVKTMGDLILNYPTGRSLQEAVNGINVISITKVHNYDQAVTIYSRFIQKYPAHPVDPFLQKMIKSLKTLKGKNVYITEPAPKAVR